MPISVTSPDHAPSSPMLLADRLLTLAQDADRAGMRSAAGRLVELAYDVLDNPGAASLH